MLTSRKAREAQQRVGTVVPRSGAPDAVSPTELFFDLVYVFAVSQLSEHLRTRLTWRGAAGSAVMLVAVFGVVGRRSTGVSVSWSGCGTRSAAFDRYGGCVAAGRRQRGACAEKEERPEAATGAAGRSRRPDRLRSTGRGG
jgi:hypothetical protein